jgi:hypothetical protein
MDEDSAEVNRGDEVSASSDPNNLDGDSGLWRLEANSMDDESEGGGGEAMAVTATMPLRMASELGPAKPYSSTAK